MTIDWAALGVVAVVSILATVVFTTLLAAGIRLVSQGLLTTDGPGGSPLTRTAGYALLGLAGLVVVFGLYLIVPIFH